MRFIVISKLSQRYIFFASSIFLSIAMIAGLLQPLSVVNKLLPYTMKEPIAKGSSQYPTVAFACNVFWGEEFLPDMLKTLDNENIKITFFIGGSWAKRFPDSLRDIASRGHELGNHTWSHPHPNNLTKLQNQEQIMQTERFIQETTNIKTVLYAPPYGEYNETVLTAVAEIGYQTILWSVDTIDWQRPSPEVLKNRVLKKVHNGAIILMHPTESTAKALPSLINNLRERGFTIMTVTDLLQK